MTPDDARPDPSRGREVLDAIDRYRAKRPPKVVPIRSEQPIRFEERKRNAGRGKP